MPPLVRLGFIGAGRLFQEILLPAFSQCPEVELLALCDISEAALAASLKRYGIRETTSDYREVLAMTEVDAVVISVPHHLHGKVAEQALRAGKHVLSEKPMSLDVPEAMAVRTAAHQSGQVYMVALPHRFDAESVLLRRWVREGRLGPVFHARGGWVRRSACPRGWFTQHEKAGGGAVLQLGAHLLDLACWLLDFPPVERVSASCFRKGRPWRPPASPSPDALASPDPDILGAVHDVEDFGVVTLRFHGGRTFTLETGWSLHCQADRQYLELFGERAGATLWPLRRYEDADGHPVDLIPRLAPLNHHHAVARHFVDSVLARESPIESPVIGNSEDGLRLVHLIRALYTSAREGREVEMEEASLA